MCDVIYDAIKQCTTSCDMVKYVQILTEKQLIIHEAEFLREFPSKRWCRSGVNRLLRRTGAPTSFTLILPMSQQPHVISRIEYLTARGTTY